MRKFNLLGKAFLLLAVMFYAAISADEALAGSDKWSQKQDVSVLFDSYNNVTGLELNGEEFAVEVDYSQESLADISPAAGAISDMDHGNAAPLYVEYQEELYFD